MLENLICKFGARYVRSTFSGYATKIGVICSIVYGAIAFIGKVFELPDIPGTQQDYDVLISSIISGIQTLMAVGASVALPVGVTMKGFKGGLKQPCPPELCPPISGVSPDAQSPEPDALGDGGLGVEVKDKWDGKPPSGSFQP